MSNPSEPELAALLAEAVDGCLQPLERSRGLPPSTYSNREWFDREMNDIFGRGWVAAARVEQLQESGAYRCVSIGGEPVVVVRDRRGEVQALSTVCRHRGTIMVEGSGVTQSIQCPHHGWTYRLDGTLGAAPHMGDQFSADGVCLPRFAVAVWGGWVLVNLSHSAVPPNQNPKPELSSLDGLLADEQLTDLVSAGVLDYPSPWNWKISVENFIESYHHQWVHPETLQVAFPGGRSFVHHGDEEAWSAVDHVSVVKGSDPFLAVVVYPNLLFAVERGVGLIWFELTPLDATSSHLRIETFLQPEFVGQGPSFIETLRRINDEDTAVNRATAQGLASPHAAAGPVSPLEETCWHFRRWLVRSLQDQHRPV